MLTPTERLGIVNQVCYKTYACKNNLLMQQFLCKKNVPVCAFLQLDVILPLWPLFTAQNPFIHSISLCLNSWVSLWAVLKQTHYQAVSWWTLWTGHHYALHVLMLIWIRQRLCFYPLLYFLGLVRLFNSKCQPSFSFFSDKCNVTNYT